MALQIHQFIDDFRKKTLEKSILTELTHIQKEVHPEVLDEIIQKEVQKERETQLIQLLDEINEKSKIKSDTTQELKDMFDNIEQQMHMQPWNKLQDSYKIEKINEYCQTNKLDNSINKQLVKLVNEKYLTSKYVNYNQMKQYIDEITLVIKDENNNMILDTEKIKKMVNAKTKTVKVSKSKK
jgi:hypothetical protein